MRPQIVSQRVLTLSLPKVNRMKWRKMRYLYVTAGIPRKTATHEGGIASANLGRCASNATPSQLKWYYGSYALRVFFPGPARLGGRDDRRGNEKSAARSMWDVDRAAGSATNRTTLVMRPVPK